MRADKAWDVMAKLRAGDWCDSPCNYREGCGCADIIQAAIVAERERCCSIVFGQASSDNVAQRTVDAIRKLEG